MVYAINYYVIDYLEVVFQTFSIFTIVLPLTGYVVSGRAS